MSKDQRLRKGQEFKAVLTKGRRRSNKLLVLAAYPNDHEVNRYGFSVGKRIGKAVSRNLVKRRLRGAAAEISAEGKWDMVVIAREGASKAPYCALKHALEGLLRAAGVLCPETACTG